MSKIVILINGKTSILVSVFIDMSGFGERDRACECRTFSDSDRQCITCLGIVTGTVKQITIVIAVGKAQGDRIPAAG